MSAHAGVIRDREGLLGLIKAIQQLERDNTRLRFSNIAATAKLIAVAALKREESRGGHYRADFTESANTWHHRTFITLKEAEAAAKEIAG